MINECPLEINEFQRAFSAPALFSVKNAISSDQMIAAVGNCASFELEILKYFLNLKIKHVIFSIIFCSGSPLIFI